MPDYTHLSTLFLDLFTFVAVAGTILVIVLDNRNPVKTMAWILVLIFVPIVGILLYLFFGTNTRKDKKINKKSYNKLLKKPIAEFDEQENKRLPIEQQNIISLFQNTSQALPFDGNIISIYTDGRTKIEALIESLLLATKHIHLQYYIIDNDVIGNRIKDILISKAQEGVEVRLIYDDVGCWGVSNQFFNQLKEGGVEVRSFLKVRFPRFTRKVNYRNHRKIVVIDGKVGFIGGMNIADRYMEGTAWGKWRDTHLKIEGKAVHGLQVSFLLDWYFVDQTLLTSPTYFPQITSKGEVLAQIVTGGPTDTWKLIMQGICAAIYNAKKYIYIQTPYFLPTESIMVAIQTAALAGVDVRLMLPDRADSWIIHAAGCSYLNDVFRAGVKVYFYKQGFLHSKLIVADDTFCTVGSTNIDFRSFEHNFEANAFMYSEESALACKKIFLYDQQQSEQMNPKVWAKRPRKQKVKESIVRILSPLY